jgi:hypothetical protein
MCVMRKLISIYLEVVLILTLERSAICYEPTIGLEIILDKADLTPR